MIVREFNTDYMVFRMRCSVKIVPGRTLYSMDSSWHVRYDESNLPHFLPDSYFMRVMQETMIMHSARAVHSLGIGKC